MLHVLDGTEGDWRAAHRRALVTLCIGDGHRAIWTDLARFSWLAYGARHGYDLVQIIQPLDRSGFAGARSPAWQKCLVAAQPWAARYERLVWLDADVVISAHASDIAIAAPDPRRIWLCAVGGQLSHAERHIYLERFHDIAIWPEQVDQLWAMHTGNIFERAGVPPGEATLFNTGVMVLSPAHHAALLRDLYRVGPSTSLSQQAVLSRTLCGRGLAAVLSPRFNWSMHEAMVLRFANPPDPPFGARQVQDLLGFVLDEMQKAYFLHFCACRPLLTLLADMRRRAPAPAPA